MSIFCGQDKSDHHVHHHHHEPEVQMIPNVVGGSYVPPHMRGSAGASSSAPAVEQRRPLPRGKIRAAPDITSELYFPSLSAAQEDVGPKGAWGKGAAGGGRRYDDGGHFEEVKESGGKGGSHMRQAEAPKLALGNKFDALRDGD
jgi:hypothetical protein